VVECVREEDGRAQNDLSYGRTVWTPWKIIPLRSRERPAIGEEMRRTPALQRHRQLPDYPVIRDIEGGRTDFAQTFILVAGCLTGSRPNPLPSFKPKKYREPGRGHAEFFAEVMPHRLLASGLFWSVKISSG